MNRKVSWGVLGAAGIALKKVIPAMQHSEWTEVSALASRDGAKARRAAEELGITKAYGSYDELLADPDIEAIYNPLPNHLHVPWTIKAAEAGKHVLCEKPIALSVQEAMPLLEVRDRTGVKIQEAFMVRTHPQWIRIIDLIQANRIGRVRSVVGQFSYNNPDPQNIRNMAGIGGGGLMDIGCYLIFFSRLVFQNEPRRVVGLIETDPDFSTDVLTSALLDFAEGQAVMSCSTRMTPFQRIQIMGTTGRIEVQIPVNAPPDRACRILIDDGSDLFGAKAETIEFEVCDQYTIQGDLFSRAIREHKDPIISLEDSIRNMSVVDAIFASARSRQWEVPATIT
jgi:predicted dehydrogenase